MSEGEKSILQSSPPTSLTTCVKSHQTTECRLSALQRCREQLKAEIFGESISDLSSSCNPCRSCPSPGMMSLDSVIDQTMVSFSPVNRHSSEAVHSRHYMASLRSSSLPPSQNAHYQNICRKVKTALGHRMFNLSDACNGQNPIEVISGILSGLRPYTGQLHFYRLAMNGDLADKTPRERASLLSAKGSHLHLLCYNSLTRCNLRA